MPNLSNSFFHYLITVNQVQLQMDPRRTHQQCQVSFAKKITLQLTLSFLAVLVACPLIACDMVLALAKVNFLSGMIKFTQLFGCSLGNQFCFPLFIQGENGFNFCYCRLRGHVVILIIVKALTSGHPREVKLGPVCSLVP